jgi:cytidylate kinase
MPVITISRLYGSGGSEVAARVAAALGWPLLDNAFVDEIARRLGTTRAEVEAREERVESLAERLARALALGSPEMQSAIATAVPHPSEEQIVEVTQRVIAEAVLRGPAVVVGRGAQSALARRADALHILCTAPLDALVARAARRLGESEEQARAVVEQTNKDRLHFVRKHWGRNWLDSANYHLCVNTAWLGIDGAADTILFVARTRFGWGTADARP